MIKGTQKNGVRVSEDHLSMGQLQMEWIKLRHQLSTQGPEINSMATKVTIDTVHFHYEGLKISFQMFSSMECWCLAWSRSHAGILKKEELSGLYK